MTFVALGGAALATFARPSPAGAQILYDTTSYSGGAPGSTPAAIAAFDGLAASPSGYGCKGLSTLDGVNNGGQFGTSNNIAYHEAVVFTVSPAQVGTWSFRWGVDFGLGGTLLLDGVELQSRWTDMWWGGGFTDPTEYLSGSANLTAGTHIIEVFGFEACCDGAGNAQFMPPGGAWQDINTTNLTIAPNVCGAPGVLLTASAAPNPVLDGSQIIYTFFYESTGTASAAGAALTTALPANTTFVSASNSGTYDATAGTVTWSLGALGVGASGNVTLTVSVKTPLADGTPITDTASLTATGATTATATTNTTVSNALLTLGAAIAPNPVAAGAALTVTLTYLNTGSGPAGNATIVDVLPANTTFVSADSGGSYDSAMNRVTFNLGTLAMGASGSVSYVAQVATPLGNGTVLGDMASLAATNNATVTASGTATVASAPTLTLTDVPAPNPAASGGMLEYKLSYGNTGSDAAAGASLAWSVPANVTVQTASNGGTYDSVSNQVVWTIGAIPAGSSGSLTVDLLVASPLANGTTLTDAASLAATNASTVMANTTVTVTSAPTLTLTESGSPNPVAAGTQLTYTLAYGNAGTDTAATAAIAAALPAHTTFVSATGGGAFDSGSGQITFAIGSLSAGATGTVTFTVAVASPLANGTTLTGASSQMTAANASAVTASATVTVSSAPVLTLTETGAPNPVAAGAQLTYTLAYGNTGTDVAPGAAIVAGVPVNTTFVSATGGGTFDGGASQVTFPIGDLAAGGTNTVTFTVAVASPLANGTTLSATASLSASGVSSAPAMAMTTVDSAPTLSLTNTGAPNPVLAGTELTYTLAFANHGTDAAHGAAVSNPLPAGVSFVSASNGGSYDSGTRAVSWTLGDIAAGNTSSVTLVVMVDSTAAAGVLSDTATLSASNGGVEITATAMTMVNASMVDAGTDAGPDAGGAAGASGAAGSTGTGATTGSAGATGSGGSGTSTGSAGATGAGGSGTSTGSAGATGSGGSGTSTGSAGTTGTGGSGTSGSAGAGGGTTTGAGGAAGAKGTGGSSAGAGGAGGAKGAAGAKGTGGTAGGGQAGATGGSSGASEPSSGCGCAIAAPSPAGGLGLLTIVGVLLIGRRRKPRR
ncbi:MAG TPA: CCXG family PEP-CTERM protein [Polyangia bacterium]